MNISTEKYIPLFLKKSILANIPGFFDCQIPEKM
jgi:hypothetical protein